MVLCGKVVWYGKMIIYNVSCCLRVLCLLLFWVSLWIVMVFIWLVADWVVLLNCCVNIWYNSVRWKWFWWGVLSCLFIYKSKFVLINLGYVLVRVNCNMWCCWIGSWVCYNIKLFLFCRNVRLNNWMVFFIWLVSFLCKVLRI